MHETAPLSMLVAMIRLIGCCGWTEAQARYVIDFPTIELQTTFYEPPAAAVAKRWKSLAPAGFDFCMKAWQLITHTPSSPTYRRLKSSVSRRSGTPAGASVPPNRSGSPGSGHAASRRYSTRG
jgi:uncharacterized protein YecE (DUF72 family)